VRTGRPRASQEAVKVEGGYVFCDQFYTSRQWQARERRREQWRGYKQRVRSDPDKYAEHVRRVRAFHQTEHGKAMRKKVQQKRYRRAVDEWMDECHRKYGALSDDAIKLLILDHEVELRQMRTVLRSRLMERAA
jgi:hypothetical protein